jgi:dephospho-CoA kinase
MLELRKVAVTGGLSCGKSSVCRFLKELGAYVVSSDDIVHHLLSSDKHLCQEVIKLLGTDILINQEIDRTVVAQKVFQNNCLLQALEKILHPAVYDEINNEYQKQMIKNPTPPLFIAEVPLLFESRGETNFDCTVVVIADPELCQDRFIKTKRHGINDYQKRSARQFLSSEKAKKGDFVIVNNGTLHELKLKTIELFQNLTNFQAPPV